MTADELAEAVIEKILVPRGIRRIRDGVGDGSFAFSYGTADSCGTFWWKNAEKLLVGNEYGCSIFSLIDPFEYYEGSGRPASTLEELEILLTAKGLI